MARLYNENLIFYEHFISLNLLNFQMRSYRKYKKELTVILEMKSFTASLPF